MVFGTFDGLHRGHLDFFKQARRLSDKSFLIISVARDKNVLKIKKMLPLLPEKKRILLLKKFNKKYKLADRIILSGPQNHIAHILKMRPDIIALGYDQKHYVKNLKKDLKSEGLTVKIRRLKPYKQNIYKNHLLKIKRYI